MTEDLTVTKQELSYITQHYKVRGQAMYMCVVLKEACTTHLILAFSEVLYVKWEKR
jgi:hypothetical protein